MKRAEGVVLVRSAACGIGLVSCMSCMRRVQVPVSLLLRSEQLHGEPVGTDLQQERSVRRGHVARRNERTQDNSQEQKALDSAASAATKRNSRHPV